MKMLITMFLVTLPAAAQAAGMRGGCGHGGGHAAAALYAVLAVLGYWVAQHAAKETANCIKRTGAVVGMTLVVIGLLGLLCGVGSHIKKSLARSCSCSGQGEMMGGGQGMMRHGGQGMMMQGGQEGKMGEMPEMSEGKKAPDSAMKKKK